ncbi:MAG: Maf family protein [bacterium]|nr:Maf family protein [bacterium]
MKIILGSQSENRKSVLADAGYVFDILVPGIDEKAIRHENLYEIPLRLAKAKAEALLPKIQEPALLITADQVIVWNGELREKPADLVEARRFLETFSGSEHPAECVNGIQVTHTGTGKSILEREISKVFFSKIPQENIEAFLVTGVGMQKAGGFDIRHPLITPFVRMEGTLESVLGLPMDIVERCMKELT